MDNQNDIDTAFSEASKASGEPVTFPGFEKVWNQVDRQLNQHQQPAPKKVPSWIPYGIAASIMIGSGIFFLTGKDQADNQQAKTVVAQTPSQPSKIGVPGSRNSQPSEVTFPSKVWENNTDRGSGNTITRDGIVPSPLSGLIVPNESARTSAESAVRVEDDDTMFRQSMAVNVKDQQAYEKERTAGDEAGVQNMKAKVATSDFNNLSGSADGISRRGSLADAAPSPSESITQDPDKPAFVQILSPGISIRVAPAAQGGTLTIQGSDPAFSAEDCLYVIDNETAGIERFRTLNAGNIRSVTVLTGKKAISMYGKKASRGIVITETKNFFSGEVKKVRKALRKDSSENR